MVGFVYEHCTMLRYRMMVKYQETYFVNLGNEKLRMDVCRVVLPIWFTVPQKFANTLSIKLHFDMLHNH